jgi:hypothetical protein
MPTESNGNNQSIIISPQHSMKSHRKLALESIHSNSCLRRLLPSCAPITWDASDTDNCLKLLRSPCRGASLPSSAFNCLTSGFADGTIFGRRRCSRNQAKAARSTSPRIPPTTPPAMAAVLGLLESATLLDGSELGAVLDGVVPGLLELPRKHQHEAWEQTSQPSHL